MVLFRGGGGGVCGGDCVVLVVVLGKGGGELLVLRFIGWVLWGLGVGCGGFKSIFFCCDLWMVVFWVVGRRSLGLMV